MGREVKRNKMNFLVTKTFQMRMREKGKVRKESKSILGLDVNFILFFIIIPLSLFLLFRSPFSLSLSFTPWNISLTSHQQISLNHNPVCVNPCLWKESENHSRHSFDSHHFYFLPITNTACPCTPSLTFRSVCECVSLIGIWIKLLFDSSNKA